MYLVGKRVRPISIRYPFGKSPPPQITDERLNELLVRLKAGDRSVIDEIVMGHIRLAIYIAGCYGSLDPKRAKDLVGEASLALIKACHNFEEMNTDSFGKFVTYKMHKACGRYVHNDRLVVMTNYARYATGQKDKKILDNKEIASQTMSPLNKMILDEKIHLAVKSEDEKEIFVLRCAGYTFEEIEGITGISQSTACRIFEVIQNRFIRNEKT